jgi:Zn finger protein HypA/HybF involved in hydrogenase expression
MGLRKTREQRAALQVQVEAQDREHAARLAALNAAQPSQSRRPLFCQDCDAKLKPAAVRCHYCGSDDLSVSQVSCPLFSQVAVDGRCPRCGGSSFTAPTATGVLAAGGYVLGGVAGAVVGAAIGAATPVTIVVCVTCWARYRRG